MTDDEKRKNNEALVLGREFIVEQTEKLVIAATQSEAPLLFYVGTVAALMGHIARAIGGESADAIMETVRPIMVAEVAKLEREASH